jgi:hypothetical protein
MYCVQRQTPTGRWHRIYGLTYTKEKSVQKCLLALARTIDGIKFRYRRVTK